MPLNNYHISSQFLASNSRYYKMVLSYDLLDDLVLFLYWGGKHNSLGGHKAILVNDIKQGQKLMQYITNKKKKRGYEQILGLEY